jgi:SAM-dependent methyltransferase
MREANFWTSRVILTAAELDVFTHFDGRPQTAAVCAGEIGSDVRATDRLLSALVTLALMEKHDNIYSLSATGVFLSSKHPESMLAVVLHYAGLWASWSQLTTVVREGRPASRTDGTMNESHMRAFIGAMDAAGRQHAVHLADTLDLKGYRRLLDIGGASGTYTVTFLRKNPTMTAVLFDMPRVIPIARERMEAEGLMDRVSLAPGDYNTDALPNGCDVALLSAVIHQNSSSENHSLFKKIYDVLQPGGILLIRDFIMDSSRTVPAGGALFALNMLVNTAGGDTYTFDEIQETLVQVGFVDVGLTRGKDQQQSDLVTASKPCS